MTKPNIQSLKKENEDLKHKLENLTKDFKELKDLLEKKERTARVRQDGGFPSPNHELEHSQQFLSDEYDDMQGKLSKLGRDLSNLLVKVNEITDAIEALQQYSYQYNLKIVGFPQANDIESSEDTAELCLHLFSCLGVDGITLNDIDIAHRVQIRAIDAANKPKPIICKFTRRLSKEKVMAARRASRNTSPEDLGLPSDIAFERIGTYEHLIPKLQNLLYKGNNFKYQHGYKFCWVKNAVVYLRKNETSRSVRVKTMDDLMKLIPWRQGATSQIDE